MSTKTVRRAVATGLGALAVAAALPAGIASATPIPGQVCILNQNTWVRSSEGGPRIYTLDAGSGFRVDHLNHEQTWIFGNGNGHSDGWIPNDGRCWVPPRADPPDAPSAGQGAEGPLGGGSAMGQ